MAYELDSPNPNIRLQYYKRRYQRAYGVSVQWWSLLQACYHYTISSRNLFWTSNQTQGAQKNAQVFDTTPTIAVRNFASKMQMGIVPPQQIWCSIVPGEDFQDDTDEEKAQKDMVTKACSKLTKTIFKYIRRSNFDMSMHECMLDLAVSTSALMVMEGDSDENPLRFQSIPANQLSLEESINGQINSCYRTYESVRIADIETMWPDAVIPPALQLLYDNDPNATVKSLYEGVVYVHGDKRPYKLILWTDNDFLIEDSDVSSPWVISRWSKINNEIFGRGPVMDAIPSILSLNELARIELAAANWNAFKPFMAFSDGVFSPFTFKLEPMCIIPVAPSSNGQFPIQPLPDAANPQFLQLTANDLRSQINSLLYANPLGAINEAPVRTATELALRTRNLAEEVGPVGPRIQAELIRPLMQRIIHILKKRGLIEPIIVNGKELDLEYQSPLVIAQGQLDVQAFLQYFQALQGMVGPEAAIVYLDPVEAPAWMAEKLNIDPKILNTREEMAAQLGRDSEKQEVQQMQQLAQSAGVPGQAVGPVAG